MTSIAATSSPALERASFVPAFKRILSMSWPIMLGALSMSALNLGQIGFLGNIADPKPLYSMSILQPYYLLLFAFLEALAITSQVFSARSQKAWKRGNIRLACLFLSVVGIAISCGLALLSHVVLPLLQSTWLIADSDAAPLLTPYLLSLAPFVVFEIFNGSLRGEGKTLPGFIILFLAVGANLGITGILVFQKDYGLDGLFIANGVTGTAAALAAAIALFASTKGAEKGPLVQAVMRMGTLLAVVGAPVFLSLVVSFVSSTILIDKVAGFGGQYAAGFVIIVRLRYFFLIPAIAMATSMAVLVNQHFDETDEGKNRRATLINGLLSISLIYLVLTALIFAVRVPLISLIVGNVATRDAAISILNYLLPSFFMVGLVASFQIVLENLGRGARVLFWTLFLEAATSGALIYKATDMTSALVVLLGVSVVYTVIFALEYAALFSGTAKAISPVSSSAVLVQ
nr:MATE family efflux transporter [uncultured Gellertiella sp.]